MTRSGDGSDRGAGGVGASVDTVSGTPASRLMRGVGAHGFLTAVRLVEQVLSVPVLLLAWGVETYGEWLMLTAFTAYFVLTDLGFTSAASNEIARRAAAGEESGARGLFVATTRAFGRVSLGVVALAALLVAATPVAGTLGLERISGAEAKIILILMLLNAAVQQNRLMLTAGYRARGAYHRAMTIVGGVAALRVGAMLAAVGLLGFQPVHAAMLIAAFMAVELAAMLAGLRRMALPRPSLFARRPGGEERLRPYLLMGADFMLLPLTQAVVLQGTLILVGVLLGPAAAAVYGAHRTLARLGYQVSQLFAMSLRAEAGLLTGAADKDNMRRLTLRATQAATWLALAIAVGQLLVGRHVFEVWTQGRVDWRPDVFALLLAATVAQAVWETTAALRLGANRHKPITRGCLVISLAGLGLAAAAMGPLGLVGAAGPALLAETAIVVLTVAVTLPVLEIGIGTWMRQVLTPPLWLLDVAAARLRRARRPAAGSDGTEEGRE